ncbi:EndoU domain-containing protein [Spirillospora sp. NPDC048819]|uniref:EndoU domain-containing protein n=1 Tax=Spirillospora sp. NPDC048819 TaxID=3155268 RepID=UPI0033FD419F
MRRTMLLVRVLLTALVLRGRSRGGGSGGAGLFEPAIKWMRRKVNKSSRHHHVFRGEIRTARGGPNPGQRTPGGYHHRFMGQDWPDRRVGPVTATGPHGTYRARVQMRDGNGQWVDKPFASTFFPDNWTPQSVDRTIRNAFDNHTVTAQDRFGNPRRWQGMADGLVVEGSFNRSGRDWNSAWPVF